MDVLNDIIHLGICYVSHYPIYTLGRTNPSLFYNEAKDVLTMNYKL